MSSQTRVELAGSRILVFTGFADLTLAKRIPAAAWDTTISAWSYPAAPQILRQIRTVFPQADYSNAVLALAASRTPAQAAKPPSVPAAQLSHLVEPAAVLPLDPVVVPAAPAIIPNLKTDAWKHQILGYQFLLRLLRPSGGAALLAMSMGTGKSLVSVGAICNLVEPAEPTLVVCPLRVVDVWPAEIGRHAGVPLRVLALGDDSGTVAKKMERAKAAMELAQATKDRLVIIINYESFWREAFCGVGAQATMGAGHL